MNSIFVIHPYKKKGIWMFDDDNAGLLAEPFVGSLTGGQAARK
jgi:hypothetical protein